MKYLLILSLLLINIVSCDTAPAPETSSRFEQDLSILQNTYWILTRTELRYTTRGIPNESNELPEYERTIHVYTEYDSVRTYDYEGRFLGSYGYEVLNEDELLSKLIVKAASGEIQTFQSMIRPKFMYLNEIIVNGNTTAVQENVFEALEDSSLIEAIRAEL